MRAPRTLDAAALNRATRARQLLLERAPMSPYDAIGHLVGLQAQTATSWYLTLCPVCAASTPWPPESS